jgi:hypothetical protein
MDGRVGGAGGTGERQPDGDNRRLKRRDAGEQHRDKERPVFSGIQRWGNYV